MKIVKKALLIKLLDIIIVLMIAFCFSHGILNITYANSRTQSPDVLITINPDGKTSCYGSLFGDELWYPGKKESGIIRIHNNFRRIQVDDLGLKVTLGKVKEGVSRDVAYNSFLNNMKLTIKQGKMFVFKDTILNDKSLSSLLNRDDGGKSKGWKLGNPDQFSIGKDDFVDLEYTLYMGEKSGDDLESLTAQIEITLNLEDGNIEE